MPIHFLKQTLGKKEAIPKIGRLCLKKAGFLNSLTDFRNFFSGGCLKGLVLMLKDGNYMFEFGMKLNIHRIFYRPDVLSDLRAEIMETPVLVVCM